MSRKIAVFLALLLPAILLVAVASPADAASGCTIRYNKQVKDKDVVVASLDPTDAIVRRTTVRWTTRMYYRWCKNGAAPDTVQFISMMFCGRKLSSKGVPFVRGVKFGMRALDAFGLQMKRSNGWLPWQLLAGKYWYAKCKYYDFGDGPVMRRSAKPFYYVFSRADVFGQADRTIHGAHSLYVLNYGNDDRLY